MADLTRIPGLKRRITATRRRLLFLNIVRAFGPVLVLAISVLVITLLGGLERAPVAWVAGLSLGTLVLILGLGAIGWRRFKYPSEQQARKAFDAQSDFRPLASLTDRPADPAPSAQTLWKAHTERLIAVATALAPPRFLQDWQAADPFRLRLIAPAILVATALYSGSAGMDRLARAFSPDIGSLMGAGQLRIDAWITPPDYTGRAPIFLKTDAPHIETARGAEATIRINARSAPQLRLKTEIGQKRLRFKPTPDGAYEIKTRIEDNTELSVHWWGERAVWSISTLPDTPPSVQFVETPSFDIKERAAFSWQASDDYGVETLQLVMSLVKPHPASPEEMARIDIDLPGLAAKTAEDDAQLDLTRHRWAGLQVNAHLEAKDGAGQTGRSDAVMFKVPQKLFVQPLALAAQEIRVEVLREPRGYPGEPIRGVVEGQSERTNDNGRFNPVVNRLEYAPTGIQRATLMLDAITHKSHLFLEDYSIYLGLRSARAILANALGKLEADSVDSLLWAVALKAEYGSAADALAKLLAAKKALERALREGASEEEIARLTEIFRQAAEDYVQAKLAEAIANGLESAPESGQDGAGGQGGGPNFGNNSFEDMLNALEDLTSTGATDQARQLLSDITNLLENLEFQQGGSGDGDGFALPGEGQQNEEDARSEEEQALSDTLEDLSETLRNQRELNDDTLEADRRGGPSGITDETTAGELAERQGEIAEALRALAERRAAQADGEDAEAGGLNEEDISEAGRAQSLAEQYLENNQLAQAQRYQERATRALSEAVSDLAQQLDALERARRGNGNENERLDPFGREQDALAGAGTGDVNVPSEAERQRAKDILDELRRRFGETEEDTERDYLERLLDRF